jgi:hypothetical protein
MSNISRPRHAHKLPEVSSDTDSVMLVSSAFVLLLMVAIVAIVLPQHAPSAEPVPSFVGP